MHELVRMARLNPHRAHRKNRGISIIEMALLLPILMLVLMGIFEYGWMFWMNQQINNAARMGARIAVTEGATNAQVTAAIDALMADAEMGGSGYTIDLDPPDVFLALGGELVTVTVTVPYANITLTAAPFLPMPDALDGETTMVKEGPP